MVMAGGRVGWAEVRWEGVREMAAGVRMPQGGVGSEGAACSPPEMMACGATPSTPRSLPV